jgi:hypothetical protein
VGDFRNEFVLIGEIPASMQAETSATLVAARSYLELDSLANAVHHGSLMVAIKKARYALHMPIFGGEINSGAYFC